jgi:NAD(P)-dependent dehydrogenase (short-subunit alcohol dehydrogenase family)
VITGASSGVGLATAIAVAGAGLTAIAAVRDPQRAHALRDAAAKAQVNIDMVRLDVTDPESVTACIDDVVTRHGRIDALVNNAGVAGSNSPLEQNDLADLRATMEVNFFGVIAVSRAAMPHLRASSGRLITIGSVRGVIGQPFNEAYSASKFAIEGFLEALAPVAAQVGVTVSLVEPAAIMDTGFVANSSGPDPATLLAEAGAYEPAFRAYREWVKSGSVQGAQTAREVAAVVLGTVTGERPPFRVYTSEYAQQYAARKLTDPSGTTIQTMTRSWVTPVQGLHSDAIS